MTVRRYGLLVLALVAIVPTAVFGVLAVYRAERTAVAEVRAGNERVAASIAHNVDAYVAGELRLLENLAADALQAGPDQAALLITAFELRHAHMHDIAVVRAGGAVHGGTPTAGALKLATRGLTEAVTGPPMSTDRDSMAQSIDVARAVEVAGSTAGAVSARIDLVGVWEPINAIRIGDTGFVRLVTASGKLLAHGDPEERREVYADNLEANLALVAAARERRVVHNAQGALVVASIADVPSLSSVVLVEQHVEEAFAAARAMRRTLLILLLVAAAVAIAVGLLSGGALVRAIEQLRAHTRRLARGELSARAKVDTRVSELRGLGRALDDMSDALDALQKDARQRERLTTFGRVSAGLAHDLRQPVEALRMSVEEALKNPDDAPELLALAAEHDVPRLVRFVEDMRRLARTGDLSLSCESFDPTALAEDVVRGLQAAERYRGIEFSVEGSAAELVADRELIHRAVTNLAANGADACLAAGSGGGVTIAVADAGDDVHIAIRDRGVGIEPERVPDILHSDFSSTKRSSGVGLGLGVARHVAESHSGRIHLESNLGHGTTVDLFLPKGGPSHGVQA